MRASSFSEDARITAIETIKKRRDFLAVRGRRRASCAAFLIEARQRQHQNGGSSARFGFTVTKKLGNAVTRNRIRRRLKAAIASSAPGLTQSGYDYVVVARRAALDYKFDQLTNDIGQALRRIHKTTLETARKTERN